MELTLERLNNSQSAIVKLYGQDGFDSVTAYRVMKNFNAIAAEVKAYEEQRIKLCEKYAKKDGEGNPVIEAGNYIFEQDGALEMTEQIGALLAETVDVKIRKVSLESIGCAKLSPAQIESIEFMLDIDGEEE